MAEKKQVKKGKKAASVKMVSPVKKTAPVKKVAKVATQNEVKAHPKSKLTKDERTWGMFCHLGALAGYIIPFGEYYRSSHNLVS